MIKELAGLVLWLVANVMYVQYRRDGLRGFKRFLAFWFGFPITIFTAFGVSGPSEDRRRQLAKEARADGEVEGELLAEIRRDRESRRLLEGGPDDLESGSV